MSIAKSLSEEQIAKIQQWADDEAGLSGIQQRLSEEFEIKVTYMETRFLIDDLGIKMPEDVKPVEAEKEESAPAETGAESETAETDAGETAETDAGEGAGDEPAGSPGAVTVTISELQRPGAMVSGRVTFANGETAEWYMDQMGRLGLNPDNAEYKPSESDMIDFQEELQRAAKEKGM